MQQHTGGAPIHLHARVYPDSRAVPPTKQGMSPASTTRDGGPPAFRGLGAGGRRKQFGGTVGPGPKIAGAVGCLEPARARVMGRPQKKSSAVVLGGLGLFGAKRPRA